MRENIKITRVTVPAAHAFPLSVFSVSLSVCVQWHVGWVLINGTLDPHPHLLRTFILQLHCRFFVPAIVVACVLSLCFLVASWFLMSFCLPVSFPALSLCS